MGHGLTQMGTDKKIIRAGCANCGAERNPESRSTLCDECLASFRVGGPAEVVQPMPHGTGPDIVTLVKYDLEGRAVIGKRKYGERLRSHNGRDALVDAYQEALDMCVYLRQAIVERA